MLVTEAVSPALGQGAVFTAHNSQGPLVFGQQIEAFS